MRPQNFTMDLADADPNGLFEDQTLGGAGNFTLDGAGVTNGKWSSSDGLAHLIGFESSANLSALTFTVTGFLDAAEKIAITETLSGPNATTTNTTNYFYSITSVASDGAVGTNCEAGPVAQAISHIVPLNWRGGTVALAFDVTGTINYTVQQTLDDISNLLTSEVTGLTWIDHDDTDLVAATTTQTGNYAAIPRATRVKVNSYTSGAELGVGILQSDVA